jgi:hypothetical protein
MRSVSVRAHTRQIAGEGPINSYPTSGDREVIPSGLPALRGAGPQPEGTHSSTASSRSPDSGAQWDDDEDSVSHEPAGFTDGNDPNLSGPHPTEPLHDWKAGKLSSWQENDDYRDFTYDVDNVAESRLLAQSPFRLARYMPNDGDYDDNGGMPTPVRGTDTSAEGEFGSDDSKPQAAWTSGEVSQGGISITPIVRR